MSVETIPALEYYYDFHPTEEDLMGDNRLQSNCSRYVVDVLEWMYRPQGWFIAINLNHYTTPDHSEHPVAPDIAVFLGLVAADLPANLPSWIVGPWNPLTPGVAIAPDVVFEIASTETWKGDVERKPDRYARMGVKEYFFFIPLATPIAEIHKRIPLRGWRFEDGQAIPLEPNEQGWIWSEQLQSWLAPDVNVLALYDADLQRRLTGKEAEALRAEQEALRAEQEALRAEREALRARQEALRAEQEALRAEQEALHAQQEAQARQEAERRADLAEAEIQRLREQLKAMHGS